LPQAAKVRSGLASKPDCLRGNETVRVDPSAEPNRIGLHIPSNLPITISEVVVVRPAPPRSSYHAPRSRMLSRT